MERRDDERGAASARTRAGVRACFAQIAFVLTLQGLSLFAGAGSLWWVWVYFGICTAGLAVNATILLRRSPELVAERGRPGGDARVGHRPPYRLERRELHRAAPGGRPRRALGLDVGDRSRLAGGEARAVLVIDPTGHPERASIQVVSASSPLLVATTTEIVVHTRYWPGGRDGQRGRTRGTLGIRYAVIRDPETGVMGVSEEVVP